MNSKDLALEKRREKKIMTTVTTKETDFVFQFFLDTY